jgi:hypothetical protein
MSIEWPQLCNKQVTYEPARGDVVDSLAYSVEGVT